MATNTEMTGRTENGTSLPCGEAFESEGTRLSEPTPAATISVTLAAVGVEVSASASGRWSARTLQALTFLLAILAATGGPVIMVRATSAIEMPWQAVAGLCLLLALMPLVYLLLGNRRLRA
ncbi:hypothetical protein [Streptomyces rimosus]